MRIVFDYQIFALQRFGGISRYFLELAHSLPSFFHEIEATIVAPYYVSPLLERECVSGKVNVMGRKVPSFPGRHYFLPAVNRFASRSILEAQQPDLIHETYYADQAVAYDCPRILTVYDMIHERFHDQFTGADIKVPGLKANAIARVDHVISISNSTRADLIEYLNVTPEKITVIPLASSLEKSTLTGDRVNDGRPYLLYVGLRGGVKNFTTLLSAYIHSSLLHSRFDLICVGGGQFSPEEISTMRDAGLVENIKQLDVDDMLLASFYTHAALFVYPSLYEGFGLPILEAMRCGCPVACSKTSSMPEVAGDAALFFDPQSQGEVQSVIESVVLSEDLADTLRLRGYEQEKKFSWEKCVRQTAEVYSRYV